MYFFVAIFRRCWNSDPFFTILFKINGAQWQSVVGEGLTNTIANAQCSDYYYYYYHHYYYFHFLFFNVARKKNMKDDFKGRLPKWKKYFLWIKEKRNVSVVGTFRDEKLTASTILYVYVIEKLNIFSQT